MSWSYTNDPANVPLDEIRLIIGDTVSSDPQLQNEELEYFLGKYPSMTQAAIGAITVLISKYSRLADETTAEVALKWSQRSDAYRKLKADLSDPNGALSQVPTPYGGGISKSDVNARSGNPDRVSEIFNTGMFDNDRWC